MKLLSVNGLHHDLNISYFDGTTLYYIKPERNNQIKHYLSWRGKYTDRSIFDIDSMSKRMCVYINSYIPHLNVDWRQINALCVDSNLIYPNNLPKLINDNNLYFKYSDNIFVVDHHYLHALSCQMFSENPYDYHFVFDGRGGDYTSSLFHNGTRIDSVMYDEGSIGIGSTFLGQKLGINGYPLDISGKLMGLQSYGKIDFEYLEWLRNNYNLRNLGSKIVTDVDPSTGRIIPSSFRIEGGVFDISDQDNKLDKATTIHHYCGELILNYFRKYAKPQDRISYSGGVAQNIIWNTILKKEFPNVDIFPHCGDEGLSLGGIEFLRSYYGLSRIMPKNFPYCQSDQIPDSTASMDTIHRVANLLANNKIVAWYQGSGEIGPRALGNRSILMDPRITGGRDKINAIKGREYYRPFGASIMSEYAKEYFDLDFDNPYMLYIGKTLKSNLDSITHVDGTCRAQTVSPKSGQFRTLLEEFYKLTGCPVLLNTSLNISGHPISGHPSNAIDEFNQNNIDVLVIGDTIMEK